jgi:hypothetical protein
VAQDTEFHGQKVPAGSIMLALTASANHDDRKFANGDAFDIHRERLPHMTFGYGFHNCLGNALARVEGRVALDEVLNRFPEWEVDLENAKLSSTSTVRGWETLPAYSPKAKRRPRPLSTAAAASPTTAPAGAETWKITLKTPMGPQEMTAQFVREGDAFTGKIESPMGSEPIGDGRIAGATLSWTLSVKKPMPIKLRFAAQVQGDSMTGSATLGMFGKAELTGKRVSS